MNDALAVAIDVIRKESKILADQIKDDPRIADLKKQITALNALEDLESLPRTSLGDLLDFGSGTSSASSSPGLSIEPDEFYGKEPLEAAKLYLRKRGKPASLAEIVAGIRSGGGNSGSEAGLRISLTRSTYQIAKINDDLFGLVDWYDKLQRGRSTKKKNGADGVDTDEVSESVEPPDANAAT